jgi:peroxiredoxin
MRERLTGTFVLIYAFVMMIFSFITLSNVSGEELNRKKGTLPSFVYYTLDGNVFTEKDLKKGQRLMIVYFNPLCDVCVRETKEIVDNIDYFKDIQILMISPNRKDEIMSFAKEFRLNKYPQVTVLYDQYDKFYKEFQAIGYPSLYLYDENRNLIINFDSHADFAEIKEAFEEVSAKRK